MSLSSIKDRVYTLVEPPISDDSNADFYDILMMITIVVSLIPLFFHTQYVSFKYIDIITVIIFIIDYLLRLFTADRQLKNGKLSYIQYPFTPMAIVDLLSILPSFTLLNPSFKLFRLTRLIRVFRVMRVFRSFRYSKNIALIFSAMKNRKGELLAVLYIALGYVLVSALLIFNVEPNTFDTFYEAVYWATVSLTTVGVNAGI